MTAENFTFRPAVREGVGIIIGIAGPSGSGKTYSALRLATGLARKKKFAAIDTESGRLLHYADSFSFDYSDLRAPFSPERYEAAIVAADKAGYPVILVDSMSHEHAGDGGLLEMHDAELARLSRGNEERREAMNMAAWIRPKTSHKHMVTRLLQCRAHIILCLRAEEKVEMIRNKQTGKMEIVPKKTLSGFAGWIPVCEKNLLYELTASFLLTPSRPGVPLPIKLQEQHKPLVSLADPLDEATGARLAEWARGGAARVEAPPVPAGAGTQAAASPEGDDRGTIAGLLAKLPDSKRDMAVNLASKGKFATVRQLEDGATPQELAAVKQGIEGMVRARS